MSRYRPGHCFQDRRRQGGRRRAYREVFTAGLENSGQVDRPQSNVWISHQVYRRPMQCTTTVMLGIGYITMPAYY
jgi:hypothetical protein